MSDAYKFALHTNEEYKVKNLSIKEITINPKNEHYLVIKDTKNNRSIIEDWADYFPFKFKGKKYILVHNPYDLITDTYNFDEFDMSVSDIMSDALLEAAIEADIIGSLKYAVSSIFFDDIPSFSKEVKAALRNSAKWPKEAFERAKKSAMLEVSSQLSDFVLKSDDTHIYDLF